MLAEAAKLVKLNRGQEHRFELGSRDEAPALDAIVGDADDASAFGIATRRVFRPNGLLDKSGRPLVAFDDDRHPAAVGRQWNGGGLTRGDHSIGEPSRGRRADGQDAQEQEVGDRRRCSSGGGTNQGRSQRQGDASRRRASTGNVTGREEAERSASTAVKATSQGEKPLAKPSAIRPRVAAITIASRFQGVFVAIAGPPRESSLALSNQIGVDSPALAVRETSTDRRSPFSEQPSGRGRRRVKKTERVFFRAGTDPFAA